MFPFILPVLRYLNDLRGFGGAKAQGGGMATRVLNAREAELPPPESGGSPMVG